MPPSLDCIITGTWPKVDGVAAEGQVLVEPVQSVAGGGYILVGVPITVQIVAGACSKPFVSNALFPALQYRITERVRGARTNVAPYVITPIPGTLDLATAPRGTGDVVPTYIPGSAIGQPGGVAGLGGDGKVPLAQLPAGATGVLDVTAADSTIVVGGDAQHPTVRVGAVGQAAVTGLTDALGALSSGVSAAGGAASSAQTTANNAVPKATAAAKGDLLAATSSATVVRVPVGADGLVLTADAASGAGVKWAAAAGGGSAPVVRRARVTSGGGTGDVPPDTVGAWQEFTPTGTLVIPAAVGDFIDVAVTFATLPSDSTFWDIAVKNGGLVEYLSSGTASPLVEGDPGFAPFGAVRPFGYTGWLDVTEDHLSGGNVTFVMAVKSNNTGKILLNTNDPFRWRAINHGAVS